MLLVELVVDMLTKRGICRCLVALTLAAFAGLAPGIGAASGSGDLARRADERTQLVGSLRRERAELGRRLHAYAIRIDATSARLSELNLELSRARATYEVTYARFVGGLVAMYKQQDGFLPAEVVVELGLQESLPEYEFFSRLAAEQVALVDRLREQQSCVRALRSDIAELKTIRIRQESELRARYDAVDAALSSGVAGLLRVRQQLAALEPKRVPSPSAPTVPQPGIGGFFVGANHPPEGYRPSGIAFAGLASWYGPGFQGNHTANGEIYNMYAFTCASRTLPFNTWLRVTYAGRAVFVRVNDRGPVSPDRVLDLSYAAATALGFSGVAAIRAEIWAL